MSKGYEIHDSELAQKLLTAVGGKGDALGGNMDRDLARVKEIVAALKDELVTGQYLPSDILVWFGK